MVDKVVSYCVRDTFYFEDYSVLNHAGASWKWTFSPAPSYVSSLTARNPKVVFGNMGAYDVSLTVNNPAGTSTKALQSKIQILSNQCGIDTIPGKAIQLQGNTSKDYASIPAVNINSNTVTFSAWIKSDINQLPYTGIMMGQGSCGFNFSGAGDNTLAYHWPGGSYAWNSGLKVPNNEWTHVAMVVEPSGITLYVNGKGNKHVVTPDKIDFNNRFILVGSYLTWNDRYFKGEIDEVCIYNRSLTQNEIRELMNLTKNNPNTGSLPSIDPSLIAYYQFNELPALQCYDKVNSQHAVLMGSTINKIKSTAPVGGGTFQRIAVNTGGLVNFAKPGVELNFPSSGTYPNGDVVVTKINVPSDQLCLPATLPDPTGYYVIRNYGSNSTFSELTKLKFKNVNGKTSTHVANLNKVKLFKRNANADGNTWGVAIDSADAIVVNGATGNIEFSTNLHLSDFGQLEIGVKDGQTIGINEEALIKNPVISIVPNPSSDGWFTLQVANSSESVYTTVSVTNNLGQLIKSFTIPDQDTLHNIHFNIPAAGIYLVSVRNENGIILTKKVIVE